MLALDAAGYGTAEIARLLGIPRRAAVQLRTEGMAALGFSTRAELVRHALREGWLDAGREECRPANVAGAATTGRSNAG